MINPLVLSYLEILLPPPRWQGILPTTSHPVRFGGWATSFWLDRQIRFEGDESSEDNAGHNGKARWTAFVNGVVPAAPIQVEWAVVEVYEVNGGLTGRQRIAGSAPQRVKPAA